MASEGTGIARAVQLAGGQSALARRVSELSGRSVTQQAISQWRRRGYVPVDRAQWIAEAVDGAVNPVDLMPPNVRAVVRG